MKCWLVDNPSDFIEIILEPGDIVTTLPGCVHNCVSEEGALAIFKIMKVETKLY